MKKIENMCFYAKGNRLVMVAEGEHVEIADFIEPFAAETTARVLNLTLDMSNSMFGIREKKATEIDDKA